MSKCSEQWANAISVRLVSKLEGLLKREHQITKYGYNLNILKRTNMDRQPADSNGRSHLQSPSGRLKPKKRADGAIIAPSWWQRLWICSVYHISKIISQGMHDSGNIPVPVWFASEWPMLSHCRNSELYCTWYQLPQWLVRGPGTFHVKGRYWHMSENNMYSI